MTSRKTFYEVPIELEDLKNVLFWAAVGIEESTGGTAIQKTVETIKRFSKQYAIQMDTPKIGRLFKKRKRGIRQISVRLERTSQRGS